MKNTAIVFAVIVFGLLASACRSSSYPQSDHFDGRRFYNPSVNIDKSFWQVLKWHFSGDKVEWPEWRENTHSVSLPAAVTEGQVSTTFVNHATHLIQFAKVNMLTDPVFSRRASPFSWVGPKRRHAPALAASELPRIDVVLISHNHYDHMDAGSIRALSEQFDPLFVVPLGNAKLVQSMGAKKIIELDWWQRAEIPGGSVTLVPVQHWSARGLFDRNQALWGGFVVEAGDKKVFFAGDTGYAQVFSEIFEKFGPMDLSFLPIGAYEPRWFMKEQHMNPEEAVQAHLDLRSKFTIGTHFGTFRMADEGMDQPLFELAEALRKLEVDSQSFIAPEPGQTETR